MESYSNKSIIIIANHRWRVLMGSRDNQSKVFGRYGLVNSFGVIYDNKAYFTHTTFATFLIITSQDFTDYLHDIQ